jgi:hypothetical protein
MHMQETVDIRVNIELVVAVDTIFTFRDGIQLMHTSKDLASPLLIIQCQRMFGGYYSVCCTF